MIAIVDYGMGNIASILNMLKKVGVKAVVSSDVNDIERADKLIFPGVGAFDAGMNRLRELNLIPVLEHKVLKNKVPILGICLGMQLLTAYSEEGQATGLGWLDAKTVKFNFDGTQERERIPHMGWNTVSVVRPNPLFQEMHADPRFYFVHSYHLLCNNSNDVIVTSKHGYEFPAAILHENIAGVQFHPEKSHKFGLKLLGNFVRYF